MLFVGPIFVFIYLYEYYSGKVVWGPCMIISDHFQRAIFIYLFIYLFIYVNTIKEESCAVLVWQFQIIFRGGIFIDLFILLYKYYSEKLVCCLLMTISDYFQRAVFIYLGMYLFIYLFIYLFMTTMQKNSSVVFLWLLQTILKGCTYLFIYIYLYKYYSGIILCCISMTIPDYFQGTIVIYIYIYIYLYKRYSEKVLCRLHVRT
jgi:hypothetical protein